VANKALVALGADVKQGDLVWDLAIMIEKQVAKCF